MKRKFKVIAKYSCYFDRVGVVDNEAEDIREKCVILAFESTRVSHDDEGLFFSYGEVVEIFE